jgi:hypothetical protein
MSAEVIAIGPFSEALVPLLHLPAQWYAKMPEGALLFEPVLSTPEGSTRSRQLASCLSVEPWDFNTHAFDPWQVDVPALRALFPESRPEEARCVEKFLRLREAGFAFHFRPNG